MIQGKANLIGDREEKCHWNNNKYHENNKSVLTEAHKLLHQKYPQYKEVGIGHYCIKIKPKRIISWRNE
jgi:hypothetical protein